MIWDFFQRYDESWIWRCADRHAVTESSRNFAALEECIADAARHGYAAAETDKTGRMASRAAERRERQPRSRSARTR
jgi:hypothetical protein